MSILIQPEICDRKLKCSDARAFLSGISDKSISTPVSPADLDFLCSSSTILGGYVSRTSAIDYNHLAEEIQGLGQTQQDANQRLQQERAGSQKMQEASDKDEKKVNSLFFRLHGKEYKDEAQQKMQSDQAALSKDEAAISADEAAVSNYIQKKSAFDQLVPYDGEYLSLTPAGILMLNELNARMSRVSDMEFSDFVREANDTDAELQNIAQRASIYVADIKNQIYVPDDDSDTKEAP